MIIFFSSIYAENIVECSILRDWGFVVEVDVGVGGSIWWPTK